jgi:uncharacterized protein (TIGR02246 family)
MQNDEQAIRELVNSWMTATKAGDTARVLTLMSDDAVFMVPGKEPFGKDAFAIASSQMKGIQFEGKSDIRELKILGDWAWMRNHLTVTIRPPNSSPITRTGYTLTILQKKPDGKWVLARDANLLA